MGNKREDLIEQAENAISEVFDDISVGQTETVEDLRDLQGIIDTMLDTLGWRNKPHGNF